MNKVTVLVPDTSSAYGDLATITPGAHPIVIAPMTLTPPVIKPKTEKELRASFRLTATAEHIPTSYDVRKPGNGNKFPLVGDLCHVWNQGRCGSCWAFSTAGASSDVFTIKQLKHGQKLKSGVRIDPSSVMRVGYTTKPKLSTGCCGGDPRGIVQKISDEIIPLSTPHCQDYSWYVAGDCASHICDSPACPQPPTTTEAATNEIWQEFQKTEKNLKCFEYADGKHYQFFINQPADDNKQWKTETTSEPTDPTDVKDNIGLAVQTQKVMKNHIMNNGSIVGGFPVFNSFKEYPGYKIQGTSGNTSSEWFLGEEKDKPIYVSNHRKFPPNSGNFTDLDGGHAVVIVGWGVSKDLSQNLNKKYSGLAYTVNKAGGNLGSFWIVRNSWSKTWGDDGYFRIAMYPGNLFAQFSLFYKYPSGCSACAMFGGLWTAFKAAESCGGDNACSTPLQAYESNTNLYSKLDNSPHTSQNEEWSGYLSGGKKFYQTPGQQLAEIKGPENEGKSSTISLASIVGISILALLLISGIIFALIN